ncbi:MAG TPA: hypothetical protein VF587_06275 [Solirubrobacteraceae bacterium]
MLRTKTLLAALLAALALAACGGDDNDDGGNGPDRAETPSAQECPPQADQALEDAAFAMKSDDFDGALATIKPYLGCPKVKDAETGYRDTAARKTLQIAKKRLRQSQKNPTKDNSPQPAVSLARNSLRYKETPEAQAFLKEAEAALADFKEKYGPKPDEETGGPPAGAGEGGPPEGR